MPTDHTRSDLKTGLLQLPKRPMNGCPTTLWLDLELRRYRPGPPTFAPSFTRAAVPKIPKDIRTVAYTLDTNADY